MKRAHSHDTSEPKKRKIEWKNIFAPMDEMKDVFNLIMGYIDSNKVINNYRLVSRAWNDNIINHTHFNFEMDQEQWTEFNRQYREYLDRVFELSIKTNTFACFGHIGGMRNLRMISLKGVHMSEEDARHIGKLESLSCLKVDMCRVTNRFMRYIGALVNLKSLFLNDCTNTEPCDNGYEVNLEGIQQLTSLEELYIGGTIDQYLYLLSPLKKLKSMHIDYMECTDDVLPDFLQGMDDLEKLFVRCNRTLVNIGPLKSLTKLYVRANILTSKQLDNIASSGGLNDLTLSFGSFIGTGPIRNTLKNLKRLKIISSSGFNAPFPDFFIYETVKKVEFVSRIGVENMQNIKKMKNLESLRFSTIRLDTPIPRGMESLANMKKLIIDSYIPIESFRNLLCMNSISTLIIDTGVDFHIGREDIQIISQFKNLTKLDLSHCVIDKQSFEILASVPTISHLRLCLLNSVNNDTSETVGRNEDITRIISTMYHLTSLTMAYCGTSDSECIHIGSMINLTHIDLRNSEFVNGLRHLSNNTNLEHLAIGNNDYVLTDEHVDFLFGMKSIKKLTILTRGLSLSMRERLSSIAECVFST